LAFLLLDIDDFKIINDTYGHQEGDNVLQRIAESGRAALRRGDLFGRIGGEEFAAVFPAARRTWPCKWLNDCRGRSSV
jgi:diguanylate cyclase (GGDEF)-like protein